MTKPTTDPSGIEVAFHEVGHAWAARARRVPFRYITLRPRLPDRRSGRALNGVVALTDPRPRRVTDADVMYVFAGGHIAEAIMLAETEYDLDGVVFADVWEHLRSLHETRADTADFVIGGPLLTDPELTARLYEQMLPDWPAITELGNRLYFKRTVSGKEAAQIFDAVPVDPRRGGAALVLRTAWGRRQSTGESATT